ncbi:hypothetical protein GIB67_035989 [Kingdonia uniflora]|uniref:RNA polymerase I-specific transcription initiation factor RRN3 n=1 Tax=Kingdonia uniflora TaxID=39325 RepID=A0A7J7N1I3_9MAGN|nr:hypothetical protein GIB67_035989 [Kingdonia uniflora]
MGLELANNSSGGFVEMEEEVGYNDYELVYRVRKVLNLVSEGETSDYNHLVGVMNTTEYLAPDEVALLVTSLQALSRAVSYIDLEHHLSLISSIFGMSMWNYGPDVMEALAELIVRMATSGKYFESCLDTLIFNFIPPHSFLNLLRQPRGLAKKDQVFNRVHAAMREISRLLPGAPLKLLELIRWRMPVKDGKEAIIVVYVESMLRLESGLFDEFDVNGMLTAVVERLVDLDVDIGWEEILQDDTGKGIFDMELEDAEETQDHAEKDGIEAPKSGQSLSGNVVAEKLDSLMVLTFDYLKSCYEHGRMIKVFQTLLPSFEKTVLNVHKSKFTQFVIFYACALDPEYCGVIFAERLANVFLCKTDDTYPESTRMNAVSYLASYLSRGRFLTSSLVASILKRLVEWCSDYCVLQGGEDKVIKPGSHAIFYAGCQAIMYILCFRMRLLMDDSDLKAQLLHMPLEPILRYRLDPLKVCLPSIVEEFLRQAKAAHLFTVSENFFFENVLESDFSRAYGGMERLDMFFPFDPILLKKCDRFIRPYYIYWSMVKSTYDDDEDGNSSSDEDADENDVEEEDGEEQDIDEFENSLNKMSITPMKKYMKHRMPAKIRPSTSPESI